MSASPSRSRLARLSVVIVSRVCGAGSAGSPPGADRRDTLVRDVVHGYCRFAATAAAASERITIGRQRRRRTPPGGLRTARPTRVGAAPRAGAGAIDVRGRAGNRLERSRQPGHAANQRRRYDMRSVLITGAAGDIGTHLRRELAGVYQLRLSDIRPIDRLGP